jgi:hypothetical protein
MLHKKDFKHRIVSIEGDKPYKCLVHKNDRRWNGWVCPFFSLDTFNKFYTDQLKDLTNINGEIKEGEKDFLEDLQRHLGRCHYVDNIPYVDMGGVFIWSYHPYIKKENNDAN